MIYDKLENAHLYYSLNDKYKVAFNYIQQNNPSAFENGKYEIDGQNIYIIIQDYSSKPIEEGKWEAHKKYTDIQFIIKGQGKLGFVNVEKLTPSTSYDEEKDIFFLEGNGNFLVAEKNEFVVFTPQDAHMPGIAVFEPEYVKKAVIKIKLD